MFQCLGPLKDITSPDTHQVTQFASTVVYGAPHYVRNRTLKLTLMTQKDPKLRRGGVDFYSRIQIIRLEIYVSIMDLYLTFSILKK